MRLILAISLGLFLLIYGVIEGHITTVWADARLVFQQPANLGLQGKVVNESEQPQDQATVVILMDGEPVQSVITTADGQFNVSLPRAGEYTIKITVDGFRPQIETITLTKDEVLSRVFRLVPSSLQIVVLDFTREKLTNAVVTLKGDDNAIKRAIEAPPGDYYFGRLKSGLYQLTVIMPGFEVAVNDSVYIAGESSTLSRTVVLQKASSIPIGDKLKERYTTPLLPSNIVGSLWQDPQSGEVWVGTIRGVARIRSSEVRSSDNPDASLSILAGKEIRAISQDSNGGLWFMTPREVYFRTPENKISLNQELTNLLKDHDLRALAIDARNTLWIASNRGVIAYNSLTKISSYYNTKRGLPTDDVRGVSIGQDQHIWIATAAGVVLARQGRLMLLANPAVRVTTHYIFEDRQRNVWFLTQEGLKKRQVNGEIIPVEVEKLRRPLMGGLEDRLGNLWFIDQNRQVYIYDLAREEVSEQLSSDRVNTLLTDREGNVWFGTQNGLIRQDCYSFVSFNTSRGLPETDLRCLLADPQQSELLWIGSANGLISFDGLNFQQALRNVLVNHILSDNEGTLWVATNRGLYYSEGKDWRHLGNEQGFENILYLCVDTQDSSLWVATKKGIARLDRQAIKNNVAVSMPIPLPVSAEIRQIYQQANRVLWMATDRGVYRYDPTTNDLTIIDQSSGLESTDVRWVIEYQANELWFATAKGIEIFMGKRVTTNRQLLSLVGESIRCIFRDRQNTLWFGATDGKLKKYLDTGITGLAPLIMTYTREKYGFSDGDIRAITQDSQGRIWFASESGLTRHLPNKVVPTIRCSVEVNGATVNAYDLESGRHNIKFRFDAVNTLGEISFIYRLIVNNLARDYQLFSGATGEMSVNDLPPGEHIFEIQALNRDLQGLQTPPYQLRLRIDRPFWRKGWFYAVMVVILLGGGFTAFVWRRRQQREYWLPTHLQTFVRIEPNPYIVGNPIRTPAMFFGREDEFNYLKTKLEGAAPGGAVMVFCGERRAGKSSILYQILNRRLGEKFIPAFIDLQEMVVANDREFFARMAKIIAEAVYQSENYPSDGHSNAITQELPQYNFFDRHKNPFYLFADFLGEVLHDIGDKQLVILMDEYELLENKVEEGKLTKELFNFLASLIDSRDHLAFVFTGSRRLEDRDRRYWRELLRRSFFRKVSFLSERDTKRLIIEPVKDSIVYGKGVADAIYHLTYGHAFYTQYICQAIVDYLNENKRNYILKSDLVQIVNEIIDNPLPQMIYFWEGFSDDEKVVMSLLAEVIKETAGQADAAQVVEAVNREKYPVRLSVDTIRLTLEELFRQDVLRKVGEEAFAFRIDLLRQWIKRSHSIWSVVREVRIL